VGYGRKKYSIAVEIEKQGGGDISDRTEYWKKKTN
jgi:hypothetical protein